MFNVGGGEILVILLLALVILGPDKLPDAARKAGKVMADVRRMSNGFQSEMRTALKVDEFTNMVKNPTEIITGGSGPSLPPLESETKAANPAPAASATSSAAANGTTVPSPATDGTPAQPASAAADDVSAS